AFGLLIDTGAREAAQTGSGVDVKVLHGATDALSVGVNANKNAIIPSATYTNFTGYLNVPAARYRIDITGANDPSTLVAPFYLDASGLDGGAAVVFASGFLDPSMNQNGAGFGLFAALADGTVAPLTAVGTARAQVIHNSADIAADTVDVYINALADTIVLNDFAFRTATPFVDLPSGYPVDVVIAGKNSTSIADGIATIPVTAENMGSYYIVANGVLDPMMYATNPDGKNTGFGLFVADSAREVGVGSDVDIRVFHGATDAPTVDVLANYSTPALVSGAAYTDFTGYLSVPPADYDLSITPAGDNSNLLFNFDADVSTLGGGAGLILASGFVDPTANQDGEGFGLLLVLADGTAILLDMTTSINKDLEVANQYINIYPNPANDRANLDYQLVDNGKVEIVIIDIAGRTVFNKNINSAFAGKYTLDLPVQEMANGIYTVIMKTEGTISMKKLVVRN
ncbi:MAG: DUF4397 domain-containing protein, partial [Bacteroidetes bacterium]|nr:DUF4397 domain-containing protein [Bacteroidota bacterium]